MRLRFLADEDLKHAIRDGVVRIGPAVDFLSAESAGMKGLRDPEVLALAAREGRILILIAQNVPVAVAIESIVEIWAASETEEWANRLTYLPL